MPRLRPIELVGIAAAAGLGWGIVMALVSGVREGAEVVLLQSFMFGPAWFFGRAAGGPAAGALAGFALVFAAVYAFEVLPMWGLEAGLRREGEIPARDVDFVVSQLDRSDIALFSTLLVGALIGMGGGMQGRADAAPGPAPPAPSEPAPAIALAEPEPPAPLWAGYGAPQPPAIEAPPPAPDAPPPRPAFTRPARPGIPWGSAFLMAAFATDFGLERLFDMYTQPQGGLAVVFIVAGAWTAAWFARRHGVVMAVVIVAAGAVLASGFATVQHAEYERRHAEIAVIR